MSGYRDELAAAQARAAALEAENRAIKERADGVAEVLAMTPTFCTRCGHSPLAFAREKPPPVMPPEPPRRAPWVALARDLILGVGTLEIALPMLLCTRFGLSAWDARQWTTFAEITVVVGMLFVGAMRGWRT